MFIQDLSKKVQFIHDLGIYLNQGHGTLSNTDISVTQLPLLSSSSSPLASKDLVSNSQLFLAHVNSLQCSVLFGATEDSTQTHIGIQTQAGKLDITYSRSQELEGVISKLSISVVDENSMPLLEPINVRIGDKTQHSDIASLVGHNELPRRTQNIENRTDIIQKLMNDYSENHFHK